MWRLVGIATLGGSRLARVVALAASILSMESAVARELPALLDDITINGKLLEVRVYTVDVPDDLKSKTDREVSNSFADCFRLIKNIQVEFDGKQVIIPHASYAPICDPITLEISKKTKRGELVFEIVSSDSACSPRDRFIIRNGRLVEVVTLINGDHVIARQQFYTVVIR